MLWEYLEKDISNSEYKPSEQGIQNTDLASPAGLDYVDLEYMLKSLPAGKIITPAEETVTETTTSTTTTTTTTTTSTNTTTTTGTISSETSTTTSTSTPETAPTTAPELQVTQAGDTNCDEQVDMADAVLIMQIVIHRHSKRIAVLSCIVVFFEITVIPDDHECNNQNNDYRKYNCGSNSYYFSDAFELAIIWHFVSSPEIIVVICLIPSIS